MWQRWLIDRPARAVTLAGRGYLLLIAALAILCFLTVGLWTLAYLLGVPLP